MDRTSLPLTDWRSTAPHAADQCNFERCDYCGCCAHGKTSNTGCVMDSVPSGLNCAGDGCGCEGRS